jgi:hypothetical protein
MMFLAALSEYCFYPAGCGWNANVFAVKPILQVEKSSTSNNVVK